jgi:hypothetical protein
LFGQCLALNQGKKQKQWEMTNDEKLFKKVGTSTAQIALLCNEAQITKKVKTVGGNEILLDISLHQRVFGQDSEFCKRMKARHRRLMTQKELYFCIFYFCTLLKCRASQNITHGWG